MVRLRQDGDLYSRAARKMNQNFGLEILQTQHILSPHTKTSVFHQDNECQKFTQRVCCSRGPRLLRLDFYTAADDCELRKYSKMIHALALREEETQVTGNIIKNYENEV